MIKVIAVGKIKDSSLQKLINEYLKRIKPFTNIEIIEVKDFNTKDENNLSQIKLVMQEEAKQVISKLKATDYKILVDLHGLEYDSIAFSNKLEKIQTNNKNIVFIIGGSYGFDDSLRNISNEYFCLSKLTFPHQLVRLLLLEQIYRSFKIKNNHNYHK